MTDNYNIKDEITKLEYLVIGYLVRFTDIRWDCKVAINNLDIKVACYPEVGDAILARSSSLADFIDDYYIYLNELIAGWERRRYDS